MVLHNVLRVSFQADRLIYSVEALERIGIVCILVCTLIRDIHGDIKYFIFPLWGYITRHVDLQLFQINWLPALILFTYMRTMLYYLGLSPHDYYTSRRRQLP